MRKLLFVFLCGCAAPLPPPDQPGARDSYRAALQGNKRDPVVRQARERLEAAEWDAARERHSIFGYRRFLDEFPDSRHGPQARLLLEGLRWERADRDGSEAALAGFLEDEPHGAHAEEAWARVSALRLSQALRSGTPALLRSWLAENPSAPGREQALLALDDADWRAAADPAAFRRYLADHPGGAHAGEARAQLSSVERDEAELLEDEPRLRALDAAAADKLAYARALALLDEGRLAQLARREGPLKAEAARDLRALRKDSRRAGELERAARALFLPRPTLDELPEAAHDRALRLREWALALDGTRLHRMLAELGSQRAWVALVALQGAQDLLKGLPPAEAQVRAERELSTLQPVALDSPQLTAVALLQSALGRDADALASARRAAGRDPRCAPALLLALVLEREPALSQSAAEALRAHARGLLEGHRDLARTGSQAARGELCAAMLELRRAAADEARAIGAEVGDSCAGPPAQDRRQAAQALASAATPLARAALARAAARDPDPDVRSAARGALAAAVR